MVGSVPAGQSSITASSETAMKRAESHARAYKASHDYSLSEIGLTPQQIREALSPLFDRFEWPEPTPIPEEENPR